MYLGGLQKCFVGCYHLSCVLASFLGIISKRRNKRESHTTLQTDYFISNVRRWQFFNFDTPSKVKSTEWDFGPFKNCFLVTKVCMLEWSPKNFCWVLSPIMCAWKLPYDHTYTQKQTGKPYDTSIRFYNLKRQEMAIFWFWYSRILPKGTNHKVMKTSKKRYFSHFRWL